MMKNSKSYTEINSITWDRWARDGCIWSQAISHEQYVDALNGEWSVLLTPCITVPESWFGAIRGKKILGLASGGGQQMPILTALGADCTVFDYSDAQLDAERSVADREGYEINIIKGDMTQRLPFEDNCFDLIFHPVSNCYVEDVHHVWAECYRVLRPGGILLAGFDNGMAFLFDDYETQPLTVANKLPFNPLKMSEEKFNHMASNHEGIQFSHSIEDQVGGQLKAGFTITDLYEDRDGSGLLSEYMPLYIATRSVKPANAD